ncbi:uncharacterized protein LOC118765925 [Octopus sinensis]|uniref:Uncharacterized protein LOC118765925 n=1 Tax=Octopus sinensis TaxID=2607531 RepID=A0A7E6FBH2_9MOLL|nr:uncharacterized protein LOC118765925 [Octopus sinensis]XP_036364661.1 uncharacterized protein LOC118765925 [Octopus sinensis]
MHSEDPKYESTKFSDDYNKARIICYICGIDCNPKNSCQHEALCLNDWLKENHTYAYYAPQQPKPYPNPFLSNAKQIHKYNQTAADTAVRCIDITPKPIKKHDIKRIPALGLKPPNTLIQPQKFVRQDDQDYVVKKKIQDKIGSLKYVDEKLPKTILHDVLVKTMQKYTPLLPELSAPSRIPREHLYGYHVDELNSTNKLILKPCYIATEQLIKSGLPSHVGLASRRPVQISSKITTI